MYKKIMNIGLLSLSATCMHGAEPDNEQSLQAIFQRYSAKISAEEELLKASFDEHMQELNNKTAKVFSEIENKLNAFCDEEEALFNRGREGLEESQRLLQKIKEAMAEEQAAYKESIEEERV